MKVDVCMRDRAEVLAVGVEMGLVDAHQAIDWALSLIDQQRQPHWSLCDIATSNGKHPADIAALLRSIPGSLDPSVVQDLLVGFLSHRLEQDRSCAGRIVSVLDAIARDLRDSELKQFAHLVDDAWILAEAQIVNRTTEEVLAELRSVLAEAAERAAARGNVWMEQP